MSNVIVDDFDIFSIVFIHKRVLEKKPVGTWEIALAWFCNDEQKSGRFVSDKANFVSQRMSKMEKAGLLKVERDKDNRKKFILDNNRVVLRKYKYPDNKMRDSLCIKDLDNRWSIFQI